MTGWCFNTLSYPTENILWQTGSLTASSILQLLWYFLPDWCFNSFFRYSFLKKCKDIFLLITYTFILHWLACIYILYGVLLIYDFFRSCFIKEKCSWYNEFLRQHYSDFFSFSCMWRGLWCGRRRLKTGFIIHWKIASETNKVTFWHTKKIANSFYMAYYIPHPHILYTWLSWWWHKMSMLKM